MTTPKPLFVLTERGKARSEMFTLVCWAAAAAGFVGLYGAGINGQYLLVVLIAWVISPVMMVLLARFTEDTNISQVFDPRKASWAFVIGDIVCLPLMLGASVAAWKHAEYARWATRSYFGHFGGLVVLPPVIGVVVGVVAALLARKHVEAPIYESQDEEERFHARTKLWHDFAAYPALAGSTVMICSPILANRNWSWYSWVTLASLIGWTVLAVIDGYRWKTGRLKAYNLHPAMDADWEIHYRVGEPSATSLVSP